MNKLLQLALTGLIIFPALLSAIPAYSLPGNISRSPQNLPPVKDWQRTIKGDTIQIADGIQFRIRDYIKETSFKKNPSVKAAFSPGFKQKFLKRPIQYTEDVQDMGDRLVIKRTILLDTKNPCDPRLKRAGLSLCFQPTGKRIKPETARYLQTFRNKVKKELSARPNSPASRKFGPYLKMSDRQLLDQLLNKDSRVKIIRHESIIPYAAYKFRQTPNFNIFDLKRPVPRASRLTSIEQGAVPTLAKNSARPTSVSAERAGRADMKRPHNLPTRTGSVPHLKPVDLAPQGPYTFNRTQEAKAKFLTGWTLGRRFGDRYEVEFAGSTFFTDRYYARFEYEVTAGFGIRWPFEVTMRSEIKSVYGRNNQSRSYPATDICNDSIPMKQAAGYAYLCAKGAAVTVQAKALDGSEQFYREVGVPRGQEFDGKEFVFEIGATCEFYASVPGPNIKMSCPDSIRGFDFGKHFSSQLGSRPVTLFNYTIAGRPLGLALDGGFGYGAMNPGVSLRATNGRLDFDVTGIQAKPFKKTISINDRPKEFVIQEQNAHGNWGVRLSNPRYSVEALLTPTMQVEIGIDLGVYSWTDKFGPYNIDALELSLGTATFDQHTGTNTSIEIKNIGTRPAR